MGEQSPTVPRGGRWKRTENREIIRPLTCVSSPLEKSRSQTALRQGMTQESATSKQMEPVLLKKQGSEFERFTDTATTLMARDYKGFGNQGTNGVIEWK